MNLKLQTQKSETSRQDGEVVALEGERKQGSLGMRLRLVGLEEGWKLFREGVLRRESL
jgi:hypothetical protein